MTELNIENAPPTDNEDLDHWHDRLVEFLRKYLSQPFDRGDPSSVDFAVGDLTTDNTWNNLDLSSILPEDAIAAILRVTVTDNATGNRIRFRKDGNSNDINVQTVRTQEADVANEQQVIIPCSTSRVIEYQASNTTFDTINITVVGWFK